MAAGERHVLLGRIAGVFGVRGELKLESWTEPRDAIFQYQPWCLVAPGLSALGEAGVAQGRALSGAKGRVNGKGIVVAQLPGVDDRDQAEALHGTTIWVPRSAMPPSRPGEYFWVDLEGLRVSNREGVDFGTVSHLFATGANDVLVAVGDRERLIPFILGQAIHEVDLEGGRIVVDWDADF